MCGAGLQFPSSKCASRSLRYFLDRLRDNLHLIFCFSPVNAKFPIRAQKFPAVFSNVNINWFLPWPEEALIAVSNAFLDSYDIDAPQEKKNKLYELMGSFQAKVTGAIACEE